MTRITKTPVNIFSRKINRSEKSTKKTAVNRDKPLKSDSLTQLDDKQELIQSIVSTLGDLDLSHNEAALNEKILSTIIRSTIRKGVLGNQIPNQAWEKLERELISHALKEPQLQEKLKSLLEGSNKGQKS